MARNIKKPTGYCSGETRMSLRYAMTPHDVQLLVSDLFGLTGLSTKLFSEPTTYISSLIAYPFDVAEVAGFNTLSETPEQLKFAYKVMTARGFNLGTRALPIIDMGTFTVARHFNNFLDFSPYTKIELYMPYIGMEQLDTDIVMGKNCHLKYVVDLHTGSCTAYLTVGDGSNETLLFSRDGQIGKSVAVAGGGLGDIARGFSSVGKTIVSTYTGTGSMSATAIAAAGAVIDAPKATPQKVTAQGANNAFYAPQFAYLIYTRPNIARPATYNGLYGRPSDKTATLGSLTGYTVVDRVHVEGDDFAGGTQTEIDQIEQLLKNGVIL